MLKKFLLLIIFLLFISPHGYSNPYSGPKPIAVMTEYDEWRETEGIKIIALYEDGTFLFEEHSVKGIRSKIHYNQIKLSNNDFVSLVKQLGPTVDFMFLDGIYTLS